MSVPLFLLAEQFCCEATPAGCSMRTSVRTLLMRFRQQWRAWHGKALQNEAETVEEAVYEDGAECEGHQLCPGADAWRSAALTCFSPLKGYRGAVPNDNGRHPVVFSSGDGTPDRKVNIPCGQCVGCRLERSRQWAMRCVHEASLYENNCFLTLTYNDEHCPISLNRVDLQKFLKRLRRKYSNKRIRFYGCGEYGEENERPHYHVCLFNHRFDDAVLYSYRDSVRLYISESLMRLWPFGFSTIGDLTFESAAYTARYIMKKVTGQKACDRYDVIDWSTGEIIERMPEFNCMSLKPGIGYDWFKKFKSDCYPSNEVVLRGRKMRPPKFYDKKLQEEEAFKYKLERINGALRYAHNNTPERLRVRERVASSRMVKIGRTL